VPYQGTRQHVTAVVVTTGRSDYLPNALWALAGQSRPADAILVITTEPSAAPAVHEMAVMCGLPEAALQVVPAPRAKNFGRAVAVGLGAAPPPAGPDALLWLLHDDTYPEPGALAALTAALELGPSVAMAGPKQVQAADVSRLASVGLTTTPFGRRVSNGEDGELDQGQYDSLDDVLAVGTAGLLVRFEAWRHLGGIDPALGPYRDGLDLSRRARLAGYRVVVAPDAVLRHEKAGYYGLRSGAGLEKDPAASFGARRRALIYTQMAHSSWWAVLFVALAAAAAAAGRFFWRLATKDFRLAAAEVAAPLAVFIRPGRLIAARRAAARTARAKRGALRPLQVSAREARAMRRDRRITATERLRLRQAPTEIEIAELRELAGHRRRMFAALLALVLAGTIFALFRLVGPGYLTGGALGPQETKIWDLLTSIWGGWLPIGTGQAGPGDPFAVVVAGLTALGFGHGNAGIIIGLVAAPVVGAVGAWFAAGAGARSVWIRAWATLFWFAAPSLWTSLGDGRLGAVVTHATLPWLVLATARAVGANRLDVRPPVLDPETNQAPPPGPAYGPGSVAAAAAAGLVFAVAAAGTPMLLLPGSLLLVLAGFLGRRGRRLRLLWAPVPALVLFAPLLWDAWTTGQWRVLLADPGLAVPYTAAPWYLQIVGWVTDPVLPGFVPVNWTEAVALALAGLAAVAALVGLVRRGKPARAVRVGWLVALTGLGLVWVAGRVIVTANGLTLVHPWAGGAASLVLAGLLTAGVAGTSGAVGAPGSKAHGARATGAWIAVAALLAGPLAGLSLVGWQWWGERHGVATHRVATQAIAPIAAAESLSDVATTTLTISVIDGLYCWDVVRGAGHQVVEAQGVTGARGLEFIHWPARKVAAADTAIETAVAALAGRDATQAARSLALSGIGFISVPKVYTDPSLEAALDAAPGLSRITETAGAVLWRVAPAGLAFDAGTVDQAARAFVVDPATGAATALKVGTEDRFKVRLASGEAGRLLVLAEAADAGWRASLGGRELRAVDGTGWQQTFELPAGGGELKVWYATNWLVPIGQALVAALTLVLALPFRRNPAAEEVEE
jgi:GT2 family glycosyltransferase